MVTTARKAIALLITFTFLPVILLAVLGITLANLAGPPHHVSYDPFTPR
jgi:hypothetical protein